MTDTTTQAQGAAAIDLTGAAEILEREGYRMHAMALRTLARRATAPHAGAEPTDRAKLRDEALSAARALGDAEYEHAQSLYKGGPGVESKVQCAEERVANAINALATHPSEPVGGDQAAKHLPGWERGIATVTMNGHQLREALEFIAPDFADDPDQLDNELTFGIVKHKDDDGKEVTGLCCWNDDTDGVLPLDGEYVAPVDGALVAMSQHTLDLLAQRRRTIVANDINACAAIEQKLIASVVVDACIAAPAGALVAKGEPAKCALRGAEGLGLCVGSCAKRGVCIESAAAPADLGAVAEKAARQLENAFFGQPTWPRVREVTAAIRALATHQPTQAEGK